MSVHSFNTCISRTEQTYIIIKYFKYLQHSGFYKLSFVFNKTQGL